MLQNSYVEGLSQFVSILSSDKIAQLLIFIILGLISHYVYLKFKKNNLLEKMTFYSFIISVVIFTGYMFNKYMNIVKINSNPTELKIMVFETHKKEYAYNEPIGIKLKFNKNAYFYLFSETQKKMIFPNTYENGKVHYVDANRAINLNDIFNVENNIGIKDEKLILLLSTHKISDYEKLLEKSKDDYPTVSNRLIQKALKPNASGFITYGDDTTPLFAGNSIFVHIKRFSLNIKLDNNISKPKESLYIDILSSSNGYVTLFEGTPSQLSKVEGRSVKSDEVFPTQIDSVKEPIGEHILLAIYTPDKREVKSSDFKVVADEKKGGTEYRVIFKSESYPYALRTYSVIE